MSFFGHYEDRHEPGSLGQPDSTKKDRYFLRVFTNPANPIGSTVMLVDVDGNSATVDPVAIFHGNLQLHISGCDKFSVAEPGLYQVPQDDALGDVSPLPAEVSFGAPRPNPTGGATDLTYSLPKEAQVSAKVFDVAGRVVHDFGDAPLAAGWHVLSWDLTDESGQRVGPGLYFVRVSVDGRTMMRNVTVLR